MLRRTAPLLAALALVACAGDDQAAPTTSQSHTSVAAASSSAPVATTEPDSTDAPTTTPITHPAATTPPPPTVVPRTEAPPPPPTTTLPPTTTTTTLPPTTTTWPGVAGLVTDARRIVEFGRSVEDRPLVAVERGTSGGAVVLVIGVIHGDEADGVGILERLATAPVPDGVDLWLVESINPDGQAVPQRGNANGVDLNRNFPYDWGPIGAPGDGQYAGTGPASEPETQALVGLVELIQPELTLWYHQDLFRLSPGEGFEGELKAQYAELTGLPILDITGGTYTGVAATYVRRTLDRPSFIVELGGDLPPEEADRHAAAVLALAETVAASP